MPSNESLHRAGSTCLPPPEAIYLALALLFGVLLAVVNPPAGTPDEQSHLGRAVTVAQGILVEHSPGELGPDYRALYDGIDTDIRRKTNSLTPRRTLDVVSRPLPCGLFPQTIHGASSYPPLPFILSAAVWSATCAAGGSIGTFLYGARIGNLILATLITAWAIRMVPFGKWLFFMLALLPMTLFQSASLSADSLTNAVAFLWLAYLTRLLAGEGRIPPRDQYIGALLALSLILCKPGYPLLLLPAVFVDRERFRAQSERLQFIAMVIGVPLICVIAWTLAVSGLATSRPGVDIARNLGQLQTAPLDFVIALKNSLASYGDVYGQGLLGILGWHDIYLPRSTYVITATLLAVSLSLNPITPLPNVRARIMLMLVAIAGAVLVSLALYATWSDPKSGYVDGLQGRYFLPLAAAALLALSFDAFLWSGWKPWRVILPCGAAIALALSVVAIGARYYLHQPSPNIEAARPYEGKLIRREAGKGTQAGWFYVENGYRRHIADAAWVQERGIDPAGIVTLSNQAFDAIVEDLEPLRSGGVITSKYDGKLVRRSTPGTGKQAGWYLVSHGKRQWIMDGQWLIEHGFTPKDVAAIPDGEFDAMPENPEPLTSQGSRRQ